MAEYGSIESKYNSPLDSKFHVNNLNDIISRDIDYNYPNMVVFVKSEKIFYYLKDGFSGDNITHWKKVITQGGGTFLPYESKDYSRGDTASLGSNMFISMFDVNNTESPITEPTKWLNVGSSRKFKQTFSNLKTLDINHSMSNPICKVYDTNDEEIDVLIKINDTNVKVFSNQEISGKIIIQ